MKIEIGKLLAAANEAKARITNKRWLNAIDRAVAGLLGIWSVRELTDGLLIETEGGVYIVDTRCTCPAFKAGTACKHRAARRLIELANGHSAGAPPVPVPLTDEQFERIGAALNEAALSSLPLSERVDAEWTKLVALADSAPRYAKPARTIEYERNGKAYAVASVDGWAI